MIRRVDLNKSDQEIGGCVECIIYIFRRSVTGNGNAAPAPWHRHPGTPAPAPAPSHRDPSISIIGDLMKR